MQLKPEQIKRFKELHEGIEGFDCFSDDRIEELANGVANYYLTLFTIQQRIRNESKNLTGNPNDTLMT